MKAALAKGVSWVLTIVFWAICLGAIWFVFSLAGPDPSLEPTGFCAKHECIGSFDESAHVHTQCADGMWSSSTGSGTCSYHGGIGWEGDR